MANKTITGAISINITVPIPIPSPLFPMTITVPYTWYPGDFPSSRQRPEVRTVQVVVTGGTTLNQLGTQIRDAVIAQEQAADGGGHTVSLDTVP